MNKEPDFWAAGSFTQTMSQEEAEKKMRTFHIKYDGMCDKCFNETYFPELK